MPYHAIPKAILGDPLKGRLGKVGLAAHSKLHEVELLTHPITGAPYTRYPWDTIPVNDRFVIRRKTILDTPMPSSVRSYASAMGRKLHKTFKVSNRGSGPDIYIMRVK